MHAIEAEGVETRCVTQHVTKIPHSHMPMVERGCAIGNSRVFGGVIHNARVRVRHRVHEKKRTGLPSVPLIRCWCFEAGGRQTDPQHNQEEM